MSKRILAEGKTYVVPDDASDDEINEIVGKPPASAAPEPSMLDRLANEKLPPPTGYLDAASRGLAGVGRGVFQLGEAIAHPIDALNAMTQVGPKVMDFLSGSGEHTGQNPAESTAEMAKNAIANPGETAEKVNNLIGQTAAGMGIAEATGPAVSVAKNLVSVPNVTAPIRMAARGAKGLGDIPGVGSTLKSMRDAAYVNTPVADIPKFKMPLQDFGLKSPVATLDPATVSQSRTMPGQVGREVIAPDQVTPPPKLRPDQLRLPEQTPGTIEGATSSPSRSISGERTVNQRPQPAAPIPPRTGLILPPRPVGSELADLPATAAKPAAQTGESLGSIKDAQRTRANQPIATPTDTSRANVGKLLNSATGGQGLKPNVPIKNQLTAVTPTTESSVVKSHTYDPASRELTVQTKAGTGYIHGDVSPEQAAAMDSGSKGKAWNDIRSNSTLVAKIVNGKRVAVQPPKASRVATPNDLTPILQQSLDQIKNRP